jgi:hypothetical protein
VQPAAAAEVFALLSTGDYSVGSAMVHLDPGQQLQLDLHLPNPWRRGFTGETLTSRPAV